MTTRRNNMFFCRGAVYACSTVLDIMDEIQNDEERRAVINEFRNRWQEEMISNYSVTVLNKAKKRMEKKEEKNDAVD